MVWYDMVWYGTVWHGVAWWGMAWYGRAWHGVACQGRVWCDMDFNRTGRDCVHTLFLHVAVYCNRLLDAGSGEVSVGVRMPLGHTRERLAMRGVGCVGVRVQLE